jgi:hypothetical protein
MDKQIAGHQHAQLTRKATRRMHSDVAKTSAKNRCLFIFPKPCAACIIDSHPDTCTRRGATIRSAREKGKVVEMSANSLFEAAARFVIFTGSIPVGLRAYGHPPPETPRRILTDLSLSLSAGHSLCNHLFLHRLLRPHVQGRQKGLTALCVTHPLRKFITRLPCDWCLGSRQPSQT